MTQENLKSKQYLSFDISQSRTGWAMMKDKDVLEFGEIQSNGSKVKISDKIFPQVLLDFKDNVNLVIENMQGKYGNIDIFIVEDLNLKFNAAAKVLLHYHAACKLAIAEHGYNTGCEVINNMTVKAYMGVKTRKSMFSDKLKKLAKKLKIPEVKVQMVILIKKLYPDLKLDFNNHDECDSVAQVLCYIDKKRNKNAK